MTTIKTLKNNAQGTSENVNINKNDEKHTTLIEIIIIVLFFFITLQN